MIDLKNYWIKHKENILMIGFSFVGFLLILFVVNQNQDKRINKLKENHLYSIGTIREIKNYKGRITADYTFLYKDFVYRGSKGISKFQKENSHQMGRKFLVIFSPKNPEVNYLLPVYADSIEWKNEGWKKPPMEYSTENAFEYLHSNF